MLDWRLIVVLAVLLPGGLVACAPPTGQANVAVDDASSAERAETATDAATGEPSPAIWSFADADTTVYLFGTVHLLRPSMKWRSEPFDTAFETSDTIYFEANVEDPESQAALLPMITAHGMYAGQGSLTATLDDGDEREVEEAARLVGVPMAALDPMRPWLAGIQLTNLHIVQEGYDPASGVEMILARDAVATGKQIGYFETPVEQLQFFATLPEADQVAFLVATAEQIEDDPQALDDLVADWAAGDVDGLAEALADPDTLGSPLIYETLLVQRNRNWLPKIEALLDDPGVKMVAVGAGHLAGEDGVVEMLRARGYVVEGP